MTRITPNYYASEETLTSYEVFGEGFDNIPQDAIGIYAADNNAPLQYQNTTGPAFNFDIVEKSDVRMLLHVRYEAVHPTDNYLGAIISADRQTVYWTNTMRPLP